MNKNNAFEYIITLAVVVCAICMVTIAMGITTIASPVKGEITLPDNITAIEVGNRDTRLGQANDGKCFHLVRAADGQPDYIVGPC